LQVLRCRYEQCGLNEVINISTNTWERIEAEAKSKTGQRTNPMDILGDTTVHDLGEVIIDDVHDIGNVQTSGRETSSDHNWALGGLERAPVQCISNELLS
jgi:hypothetical protein